MSAPSLRFLSLFVPDLDAAVRAYQLVLDRAPLSGPDIAPAPHPYAARGPVVFDCGGVLLALYQCDGRTTHPGDVGLGLDAVDPSVVAQNAARAGARVFYGPRPMPGDGRSLAVCVMPDRHFFEVVGPRAS